MKIRSTIRQLAVLLTACIGISLLTACSTTMSFGSMPQVERLQTLTIGTSNAGDVVRVLGEPRGHGQMKIGSDIPEQQVWLYEYVRTEGNKVRAKILLVFMDKNIYVGHMWFSSNQLMGTTQ